MKYASAYGVALVIFLIIDAVWLGIVARSFYTARIGELLLDQPRWGVAIFFYALYIMGVVYFAVATGLDDGNWLLAAFNGALFGFFAYLTYNATNLSVMRGYDETVAIVDTLWGTGAGAIVAGGTVLVMSAIWRGGA